MLGWRSGVGVWLLVVSSCNSAARHDATARSATVTTASANRAPPVIFGELTYPAPAGFTLKDDTSEDIPSPIPGGQPANEHFRSYVDAAGHGLYLFAFHGFSGRDRGPMKADESWPMKVGGRDASVSRVSMFFGREQQLLTAHFDGPSGANYVVYTDRLDRPAFEAFLATLSFR